MDHLKRRAPHNLKHRDIQRWSSPRWRVPHLLRFVSPSLAARDEGRSASALGSMILRRPGHQNCEWRTKRTARRQRDTRGPELVTARCASRSEVSHLIRRITDGVIAENQGKARGAGDLRVALFPSKHSRVRIPSPALDAEFKAVQPPTRGQHQKCILYSEGQRTRPGPFAFPDSPRLQ